MIVPDSNPLHSRFVVEEKCPTAPGRENLGGEPIQESDYKSQLQQDFLDSPEQSQVGSVRLTAPMIIAVAQPTPDLTSIASAAQLSAQAPHSIHASLSTMIAFPSISKTACGQTIAHKPHPVHLSASNFNVTTLLRYLSARILSSRFSQICWLSRALIPRRQRLIAAELRHASLFSRRRVTYMSKNL